MARKIRDKIYYNSMQQLRESASTVNSQTVYAVEYDNNGKITRCYGTVTITDAGAGYAKGCVYVKTDGAAGSTFYINEGSSSSCDFNVMETSASTITGVTADYGLLGSATEGTATLSLGLAVRNESGSTITKGSLVRVSGLSSGAIPLITLADADGGTGFQAQYVLTADIANNANGNVYRVALVTGLNTNALNAGDIVYLSGTAGAYTASAPVGDIQCVQRVGMVIVKNATTGSILFDIRQPEKIGSNEIQDGAITTNKQSTAARTRVAVIPFSLPAPTGADQLGLPRANFICSQAFTVVSVKVFSTTATTGANATNHYEFMARNTTAAANLHTVTTSTQGAEISANAAKTITVSQNLSFTANQVFQLNVDIKDDGSAGPTNLSAADLSAVLEYTI